MKKWMISLLAINCLWAEGSDLANAELLQIYEAHCAQASDIHEHLPMLRQLAGECSSVVELGVRFMVSSWSFLQGLVESSASHRSYVGVDINDPPGEILDKAKTLAKESGISFRFWRANDRFIMIPRVDMLFIDSLHTYHHLTYELERFSPNVLKYIVMHDTSEPWGYANDDAYSGDFSEYYLAYPPRIDRSIKGLWPAVEAFLSRHPEWILKERYFNNHGLTILQRVSDQNAPPYAALRFERSPAFLN